MNTWSLRPPSIDEVEAVHHLMTIVQAGDGLPMLASIDEVTELFSSPDIDPASDLRVIECDEQLVAYGVVDHSESGARLERALLFGGVHPGFRRRGIGQAMIQWQVERGREQLEATSTALPATLMTFAYDFEHDRLAFLEAHGFAKARFDLEMMRTLDEVPKRPDLAGIEIRPWVGTDPESTRRVFNASFADHWGSTDRSAPYWEHMLASAGHRLDFSFVAADADSGEIVAIALNGHYPDDQQVTGRLDGWIETLGTVRSHRKRGIASALIVESLHAFASAGFDHAMLGVDTENPSGAYGIYADLGFTPLHTNVTLLHPIR